MQLRVDLGRESRQGSRVTEFRVTMFLMAALFALVLALLFSDGTSYGL